MKKVLIIGGGGFVGKHLCRCIKEKEDWKVYVTEVAHVEGLLCDEQYTVDITKKEQVTAVLEKLKPDYIFHLAAQSSVALSWENPQLTVDVNIKGSLNLLEAVKEIFVASDKKYSPRVMLIGSGEEYGRIREDECPINEENTLRPGNIYAATKACQNMLGKIYADAYGLDIVSVRAFNHIGPGQSEIFVVADFCKQVSEIEKGEKSPSIHVGNLSAKRDFTDVKDVVEAYRLLVQMGKPGETYNVGSGQAIAIDKILECILSKSTHTDIEVMVDKAKLRPVDVPIIEADIEKLVTDTGWTRNIPLEETIEDTLEYWRNCT